MPDEDRLLEQAFNLMGRELHAVEPAEARVDRRTRVVGRLRSLHVRLLGERSRSRVFRRRMTMLLVAVLALSAGAAIAAVSLGLPLSSVRSPPQQSSPLPVVAAVHATTPTPQLGAVPVPPAPVTPREAPEPSPPRPLLQARAKASISPVQSSTPAPSPAELELAAVNQLFVEAKRARREHQDARALALCEELLAKYPRSVLAHEAAVERLRALKRLGRAEEARRRADEYLRLYPAGFAANEARQIADAPQSP